MTEILSPVDRHSSTVTVTLLQTSKIINEYSEMGYDVSRFFEGLNTIEIRKCLKTGYRFYYPFNIFGDERFYIDIQNHADEYYPTGKWEHRKAYNLINPNTNVLEVGCATGYFMQMLQKKNCNVVGLELNNKAVHEAQQRGLIVYNEMLELHAEKNRNKYDYVCSFQVLEHLHDIKGYFDSALKCLKPTGKLIIGVPNSNPYLYKWDIYHAFNLPPHHAGLWNKQTFENVASVLGLETELTTVEKLKEYKIWYQFQLKNFSERKKNIAAILRIIPRPVYKAAVKLLSPMIEGRNILVMLKKKQS